MEGHKYFVTKGHMHPKQKHLQKEGVEQVKYTTLTNRTIHKYLT